MKIFFAGIGFESLREILIKKINEKNQKIKTNEKLELVFQDHSKTLASQVEDASVLIPTMEKIDKEIIKSAQKLQLIQQFGVGLEGVDIKFATDSKIYVANAAGTNGITVAESVIFLMLALSKRLNKIEEHFENGELGQPVGNELYNKTLGIIGLGNSGKELAKRAKAFNMKLIAIKKNVNPDLADKLGLDFLGTPKDLDYILKNSDYISLNLPANKETINLLDESKFLLMHKRPFIINCARGPIIERKALKKALENDLISGAALDVFWEEPPNPNDSIFEYKNVIATPHIAGTSHESIFRMADIVVHNILSIFNKDYENLKCVVNNFSN
ncbi:MAG: lactate dehydrogenase [Candidatus Lokiarchaeota archaeon]|nr:lactate dehydrogenase [Candidatus Lokiarchaeota archaeon]